MLDAYSVIPAFVALAGSPDTVNTPLLLVTFIPPPSTILSTMFDPVLIVTSIVESSCLVNLIVLVFEPDNAAFIIPDPDTRSIPSLVA